MGQQDEQQDFPHSEYAHQINQKSIDYYYEYKLIQHRTNCQCFQDSQKFNVEFSKIALQGTFLLNGAGLIPIIYSKVDYFYSAGMWFAAGAGVSVLAACATFVYQDLATQTWHKAAFKTDASSHREEDELALFGKKIRRGWLPFLRAFAVVLVGASLILFAAGLYQAGNNTDTLVKKLEKGLEMSTQNPQKRSQERVSNSPLALDHVCESAHRTYHSNHD